MLSLRAWLTLLRATCSISAGREEGATRRSVGISWRGARIEAVAAAIVLGVGSGRPSTIRPPRAGVVGAAVVGAAGLLVFDKAGAGEGGREVAVVVNGVPFENEEWVPWMPECELGCDGVTKVMSCSCFEQKGDLVAVSV